MKLNPWPLLVVGAFALAARAQAPTSDVTESTDPARVAAVEKAAREIQARAAQDASRGGPGASAGLVRGKTAAGWDYLSGGVTAGERVTMHAERRRYSLWVSTVARPSGAYLTDARLRIVDSKDKSMVLDRTMDGPWFMVNLPPGRYEVMGAYLGDRAARLQTLSTRVSIAATGQRQAVLRFDSAAQVGAEMQSPFNGNPFAAPPAGR